LLQNLLANDLYIVVIYVSPMFLHATIKYLIAKIVYIKWIAATVIDNEIHGSGRIFNRARDWLCN